MTEDRYNQVMYAKKQLTEEEIKSGYHFCPDWDEELIGYDDTEIMACRCKKHREASKKACENYFKKIKKST